MSTLEHTIASERKASLLKQPQAVWAVAFACIIAFLGLGLVDPILPAIAKKLDASALLTTAVMNAAPVERSTASAAYSFLRFIGGAIAPYFAGKMAEWFNPHVPFVVGAGFVIAGMLIVLINQKHVKHVDQVEAAH